MVVHPVNSKKEIDELISEANRSVFASGHRQVRLMVGRVKEIADEIADKSDIFFVEKEKREEMNRPKKTFKVYQKDKDKGKGKIGRVPNIKITDNLPPPPLDTASVHSEDPPVINTEGVTHDDTNPKLEILFTMNVHTREVNIVVDKDNSEVKVDIVDNKKISKEPTQTIDSQEAKIPTQIEQLSETEKPIEDKGTCIGPLETVIPTVELSEKQTEVEVHIETEKSAITATLK